MKLSRSEVRATGLLIPFSQIVYLQIKNKSGARKPLKSRGGNRKAFRVGKLNYLTTKKSKLFNLNVKDVIKAIILTFITALLTGIYQILQTGTLLTWVSLKPVVISSIAAALGYIIKNVLTNSNDEFMKSEPKIAND